MEESKQFEVIVGNIGTVYSGPVYDRALAYFREYVTKSTDGVGRAAFEWIVLWKGDGTILFELSGPGEGC